MEGQEPILVIINHKQRRVLLQAIKPEYRVVLPEEKYGSGAFTIDGTGIEFVAKSEVSPFFVCSEG